MTCPKCGKDVSSEVAFCPFCGSKLNNEETTEIASQKRATFTPPSGFVPPRSIKPVDSIANNQSSGTFGGGSSSLPLILVAPAVLLLCYKLLMALYTLLLSMKDFNMMRGVFGSPWVGFKNFAMYFSSPVFGRTFLNTLILGILPIIVVCIVATMFIICITMMSNKWLKYVALTVIAIPAFMPTVAFTGIFLDIFSSDGFLNNIIVLFGANRHMWTMEPFAFPFIFTFLDILKNAFIPTLIGVLALQRSKNIVRGIGISMTCYALFRLTFIFSPDIELILSTYNPTNYVTSDVLDTFIFRQGLISMAMGGASAAWIVKSILQFIVAIVATFGILMLGKQFESDDKVETTDGNSLALLISAFAFLMVSAPFWLVIFRYIIPSPHIIQGLPILFRSISVISMLNTFLTALIGGIIFAAVALVLAYPLTFKTKWYPFILIAILAVNHNFIGEYLLIKTFGMINTPLPSIFSLGFSTMGAFGLYYSIRNNFSDNAPDFSNYLRVAILPTIMLLIVAFIANWGIYFYEMIYVKDVGLLGLGNLLRKTFQQDGYQILISAGVFTASIIPVLLGVGLIWLDAFLPISIMTLFTSNAKK